MHVLLIKKRHMTQCGKKAYLPNSSTLMSMVVLLDIIKDMYLKSSCAVKIGNKRTNFFRCKKGVRQGCPLSHKHTLSMPQDSIIYQALLMDKNLHRSNASHITTLTSYIRNLNLMNLRYVQGNNCNLENSNKKQIKSILSEYYKDISLSQLSDNPKARLYLQYKTEPRYEPYLDTITNRKIRVQYTKFRLSDHDLEIEKGRHMKVERGSRYCKLCTTGDICDELHLLFNYNKLYKSQPSFLNYMYKNFSYTKQLDDTGKFIFSSRNENKTIIKKFSEYVYELFNERYRISNFIT